MIKIMRVVKIILAVIIIASISMGSYTKAAPLTDSIQDRINSLTMSYGEQKIETNSINYNDEFYLPSRVITELLDMQMTKNKDNLVIEDQLDEVFKLRKDFIFHGFYALSSYKQFDEFYKGRTLNRFDSISVGWSRIDQTKNGVKLILDGRDFYVPEGYDEALDKVAEREITRSLMVYADDSHGDYFKEIFEDGDQIIKDIDSVVKGKNTTYKDLAFDGVTIDFENVNKVDQDAFVLFLTKLRNVLGTDKTIQVAIPSVKYYGYYHHKEILEVVDYMIMMEHDFETTDTSSRYYLLKKNPPSPIKVIEDDMKTLLEKVGKANSKKIILQINFDITQWIGQGNGTYKRIIASPTYGQLYDRINKEISQIDDKKKEIGDLLHYSKTYENPYIIYENDKKENNYIWYENWDSVLAKIKLANDYNLAGISLWRIGTIPNYFGRYNSEAKLDIWYQINNLLKEE